MSADTRLIWIPNGRSAQASVRSANRTTSSSSTVASARLSVLDTSALSRTLERAERRRTPVGCASSVKPPERIAVTRPLERRRRTAFISLFYQQPLVDRPRAERAGAAARPSLPLIHRRAQVPHSTHVTASSSTLQRLSFERLNSLAARALIHHVPRIARHTFFERRRRTLTSARR